MSRGWCPGVFAPMEAKDGLLVRIKPRIGRLSAMVAREIAAAAARFGNGRIELTSRANLQLRGLRADSVGPFARAMVACGAADADAATERRRTVVVSPLAGDDPSITGRPERVTAALEQRLAEARDLILPDKFGFAVDGGGVLPLRQAADIVLESDEAVWWVRLPGADLAAMGDEAAAVDAALLLARVFQGRGGRMRDLVAAIGAHAVCAAAGLRAHVAPAGPAALLPAAGMIAYADHAHGAVAVAPPGGELTPASLVALADRACAEGDGFLRISPWRVVLVGGVRRDRRALAA